MVYHWPNVLLTWWKRMQRYFLFSLQFQCSLTWHDKQNDCVEEEEGDDDPPGIGIFERIRYAWPSAVGTASPRLKIQKNLLSCSARNPDHNFSFIRKLDHDPESIWGWWTVVEQNGFGFGNKCWSYTLSHEKEGAKRTGNQRCIESEMLKLGKDWEHFARVFIWKI